MHSYSNAVNPAVRSVDDDKSDPANSGQPHGGGAKKRPRGGREGKGARRKWKKK